jgi:hypothetical protein
MAKQKRQRTRKGKKTPRSQGPPTIREGGAEAREVPPGRAVQLLELPVETLNHIITRAFSVDARARLALLRTSKELSTIVKSPSLTRHFAIYHFGNATKAIYNIEEYRWSIRDTCDNALLDTMDQIAAGIDYSDAEELERMRECYSHLFDGTDVGAGRTNLALFAMALLVLRPEAQRRTMRYDEIRGFAQPFLGQLALWKDSAEHASKYRRYAGMYDTAGLTLTRTHAHTSQVDRRLPVDPQSA